MDLLKQFLNGIYSFSAIFISALIIIFFYVLFPSFVVTVLFWFLTPTIFEIQAFGFLELWVSIWLVMVLVRVAVANFFTRQQILPSDPK